MKKRYADICSFNDAKGIAAVVAAECPDIVPAIVV